MDPTGCGTPALNDLILNHARHPVWDVRAQGQRIGDSFVLCGGEGFEDVSLVGSLATAGPTVDSSAFLAGCHFMNLFVTRNPVPQSLPGDLGPLVELRTTDAELQLIVPAMHFAKHAHMNKLFGQDDVAGIEQVVLVPFNSRTMVSREQALAQAPAVVREDLLDVVAVDAAHLGRPMPACDMINLDGVALMLANAYDEAAFEGLATYDAVADSESIRLGHRVRPQAKDVAVGEDVLQVLGPGAWTSGAIYPPRLLRNVLGGDSTTAVRRAVVDQLEVASSRVMGSTAMLLSQAAPHVLAQMGVAMGGSLHVYPPRQWQESVAGCYLPAASLVIRKKGVRACVQHGEGVDVLAAARRQVGVHSDDGDDYGILIYTRPVMERPAAAESRMQSLGKELEEVLQRGGLALVLHLRGGRGAAVWAPYHQRPAQYQPRADADRAARANILAAWRAAGAPRLNAAAGAVAGGAIVPYVAPANDAPGDEAVWEHALWDAGDDAGAAAAGGATAGGAAAGGAAAGRDSRAARASTLSERPERDAQRRERDVQRAALEAEKRKKRQKRHEQQQSHDGQQFDLVQARDGRPIHATLTTPEGRLSLPTWGLLEKLLKEHPSLSGSTEYQRFLTLSGNAFFADAVETDDAAEVVEHMSEWQRYMMDCFERFKAHPGAGSSIDAPLMLH